MSIIVVNAKAYKEGIGKNAVKLAKIMEKVGNEYDINMAIAVQPSDIFMIANEVAIDIFSQHVDAIDYGSYTGWISPYAIKEAGAKDLKTCVLVAKRLENPTEQVRNLRENLKLDWVGFTIPDRWIAGYGIDAGEDFRFLPFIVARIFAFRCSSTGM
mgnify:CR=1 FL=1